MKSEEIKKYKSEWFKSESGKKYQYNRREKSRNNRIVVLAHYGGSTIPKCIRCGFDDIRALQLDHVNGNGFIERKQLGGHQGIFRNIIKNGFPPGYQTLCANCNWIKVHEQREFVHNRIMGQDGNL